jgi:3-oxoisoapionate kinase
MIPDGPLIAFYGDDFTGSSASMEVLTFAGLPTVLFVDVPTRLRLARFADRRGIGIAGIARSKSPAWMEAHLPAAFEALARLRAPVTHYKVCSTFDSAPHVGSIGKAVDIAVPILGGDWHPLLVAAPAIHRYQLFGNLFAVVDGTGYRLDRHPTMSRHPVTPMDEADVRRHLARQTSRPIGLVDWLALTGGRGDEALAAQLAAGHEIVAIDVLDEASLAEAGRLIWENRGQRLFSAGSQGVEYALVGHWRQAGLLAPPPPPRSAGPSRIAAVSGSCSPVTARQIAWAAAHGFTPIRLEASRAVEADGWRAALEDATRAAREVLDAGSQPLVFTAAGPDDAAIPALAHAIEAARTGAESVNERIGRGLGAILRSLVERDGIRRIAVAGGDTSGHALSGLGVHALEAEIELAPACALSRAHSDDPGLDGLEVALKGGQMGPIDYFGLIAAGRPTSREGTG